jgi:hypothetical protein
MIPVRTPGNVFPIMADEQSAQPAIRASFDAQHVIFVTNWGNVRAHPKETVGIAGPDFTPGALRFQKCFIGLWAKNCVPDDLSGHSPG